MNNSIVAVAVDTALVGEAPRLSLSQFVAAAKWRQLAAR